MLSAPKVDNFLDFNQDYPAKRKTLENLKSAKTLVIIDPNVANPQQLAAGVILGAAVKILNSQRDGIIEITEILREYPNIETLHLVSHGSPGCIYLGNSKLNLDTLALYAAKIATWFFESPNLPISPSPRLLIYGCHVAQGTAGRGFISKLQQLTHAQIQASSTKVGNSNLGGNWQLDIAVGEGDLFSKTEIAFNSETQKNYAGIFIAPVANDDPLPYPAAVELSNLDGSNGFVLNGINIGDRSGRSVSNAGDVNGDGLADLIIGADSADPNGNNNSGESYVVFGTSNVSAAVELSSLDGNNGFVIKGIDTNDFSGFSVSDAGDFNGDGLADLIIGGSAINPGGNSPTGESYLVFGTSNPSPSLELSNLDGSNGFVIKGISAGDRSGRSVSGAGDFNGDGLADLIIGADSADPNGNNNSGESYVVFGTGNPNASLELSNLDGNNGFVIKGINADDRSGWSVSGAGDVNGDGLADLIIGATEADPHGSSSGESYVVFGTNNPNASLELSELDGSNGFVINGITGDDRAGRAVSGAGDFNGDGLADLLIGAQGADPNGNSSAGESYVVFGTSNPSAAVELSELDGSNGLVLNGIDEFDTSGFSVSSAGDINGDGLADLIIGAYKADPNGIDRAGESYVVFGTSNPTAAIELSELDGSNGFVLEGIDIGDRSGSSVSGAGDFNGDGVADLIIGALYADPNDPSSGESYVVFGRDFNTDEDTAFTTSSVLANDTDADGDPLSVTAIDTTGTLGVVTNNGDGTFDYDPNGQFESLNGGESATDTFSYTISDGTDTDTGTVTIAITGVAEPNNAPLANDDPLPYPAVVELSNLDGSDGFVIKGINEGDRSGRSVSNAGDVNGDGLADLIIGAAYADPNGSTSGASYVVFGTDNPSSSIELSSLDGSNGFIINGINEGDHLGRAVSGAGDVNNDGLADLIIGAYLADPNGTSSGESYVVFGTDNPSSSLELSSLDGSNGFVLKGIDEFDNSGFSVSNAGDFNGDGLDDLIIGADSADPNGSASGESYLVFGTSNPSASLELSNLDGSNGFVIQGIDWGDRSGKAVSSAGDFNGDGLADLIIGADGADTSGNNLSGESYVVFGTSNPGAFLELSDLNGSNGFVLKAVDGGDRLGFSVSSAGDFNGDGLSDLIVGAYGADPNGNSKSGESYVVFGTGNPSASLELSSLDGSNGFVLSGITASDYSGKAVSGAGDINGDGLADLIIGAHFADPNGSRSGESYVVFGTSNPSASLELSNLDGSNGFILNGITPSDNSGFSVSGAGDVNGDGLADLIIGAYAADSNGSSSGESYVVFGRNFNTDEDTAFTTSSVLANDTDADGDSLSVISIDTTGTLGIVTNNGDGTFDYDPNGQFDSLNDGESATDTFSYTISDGIDTDTGTVTIAIAGLGKLITGTNLDDNLVGGLGKDTIKGFAGNDLLLGHNNDDSLVGSNDNDTLDGGIGADTLWGNNNDDSLVGGDGNDTLGGGSGADILQGGNDDDSLSGGHDNDSLLGNDNNDTLGGGSGADILQGGNHDDSLVGGNGNDTLNGENGVDILRGGNDDDSLVGGDGNDTLKGENGADILEGNNNDDSLVGGDGNDTLDGGIGADTLWGNNNDDSLVGGDGNDTLGGGSGADILQGDHDDDKLYGSSGNDTLIGGLGFDRFFGGAGSDRFKLESTTYANRDVVQDFEDGIDLLELDGNLSFGALTITQAGSNTNIIETATTEIIAVVKGIDAVDLDINDFI